MTPAEFLLSRVSPPITDLKEPGPVESQVAIMLSVASHVPDHGRLVPWRFILYSGEARSEIGRALVHLAEQREGPLSEGRRSQELTRFSRAPLVVGVVSSPKPSAKIPESEMVLSGGAAAMSLLFAAHALGFGANWVTNWYSDVPEGRALLGLAPHERVIGFVHIGTPSQPTPDRPRPDLAGIATAYSGPWSDPAFSPAG